MFGQLRSILLISLFNFSVHACQLNEPIDIYAKQVPISLLLTAFAEQQQLNLLLPYPLEYEVSLQLKQVCTATLLTVLNHAYPITVTNTMDILSIVPKSIKESEKIKLIPWVVTLQHTSPSEIADKITHANLLSAQGKITVVPNRSQLILYDKPDNKIQLNEFIQLIDKKREQVHIAAQLVTINSEQLHELGIKWSWGAPKDNNSAININLAVTSAPVQTHFNLGKWQGRFLNLELSALEAENKIKILAAPHLITQDGYSASIKQGTEIPYEITQDGNSSFEFKQAVLGLEVTPNVINENEILLTLHISQNTPGSSLKKADGSSTLTIDTQEITTQVLMSQGETLVLGGIKQQQQINKQNRVPILGQVPLLGTFFTHQHTKEESRELVIFITPHIL